MRKVCGDVLSELGLQNVRLFKLAVELEKIALEDDHFEMVTCIFALARTVGWMTQWEEMITDPEYKIGRPRQLWIGAAKRDVVPLALRGLPAGSHRRAWLPRTCS